MRHILRAHALICVSNQTLQSNWWTQQREKLQWSKKYHISPLNVEKFLGMDRGSTCTQIWYLSNPLLVTFHPLVSNRNGFTLWIQSLLMHTDTSDQLFMVTGWVWLEDGSFEYVVVKEVESGWGGGRPSLGVGGARWEDKGTDKLTASCSDDLPEGCTAVTGQFSASLKPSLSHSVTPSA